MRLSPIALWPLLGLIFAPAAVAQQAVTAAQDVTSAAGRAVAAAQERPALASARAAQAVMLAAARAGARIVAVGERGIVLLSDDGGQHWRQAAVPVSVTLTAVRFVDARVGVATGHAGVVLTTGDGGAHWQRVLDGKRMAELALASARVRNDAAAVKEAERLVADGADKPLLDVCLLDGQRILAVGAYGLAFGSEDGGRSWTSWMDRLDNPKGMHLNAVRRHGDTVLVAGERGLALLSTDAGRSFQRLEVPYQGSFFTAELTSSVEMVLAGLRGNAWRSADGGRSWQQLINTAAAPITASAIREDGSLVFANQAGMLLNLKNGALAPSPAAPLPPLNGLLALDNGSLLAMTVQGLLPVTTGGTR
jgi:photosystem II stability/assembly factor-like uncharacterized protein